MGSPDFRDGDTTREAAEYPLKQHIRRSDEKALASVVDLQVLEH